MTLEDTSVTLAFDRPNGPPPNHSTPSILFLHGSESCHLEFTHVITHLNNISPGSYDIITLDLPAHSASHSTPFSFPTTIAGIRHIITSQIPSQRCHIVGLSLGGFLALQFAREYPDFVVSVFCTGCTPFGGIRRMVMERSWLLAKSIEVIGKVGTEGMFWASFGRGVRRVGGLRGEVVGNQNVRTLKPVFDELVRIGWEGFGDVKGKRVCIVAGGRGDNVRDAERAGRMFREGNEGCRAFVVRRALHWWSVQLPEVFAEGVRAWVEGEDMPEEYEDLLRA